MIRKKAIISILDIREHMSGVEMSAANRSNILEAQLGLDVVYLTINFNTSLYSNLAFNKKLKRISENSQVINMYDYYQENLNIGVINSINLDDLFQRSTVVSGTNDRRIYNQKGEFIGFCKSRSDCNGVEFINYLNNGSIVRRDFYDVRGFLSRSDSICKNNQDEIITETYFRSSGVPAIIKRLTVKEKVANLDLVEIFDNNAKLIKTYSQEKDFIEDWINEIVKENSDGYYIIDRCTEYAESLIKAIYKNKAPAKTIPVIHNVHTGNDVFDGPVSTFYKSVLENVDAYSAIVTLTEHQQRDIQDRFGGKNFYTIPHSYFEIPEIKPYEQRDRFKVVYLARYDLGHKQQDMALKAFKLVVNAIPMAQLYLHGFGADKDKIANLVKEMGLEANVHVNDFVADISLVYKDASLSILTSRVEAFCLSVMESLFHGCPVVSFDMKYGPASMIVNGENGFLIPPNDIEMFASKIIDVLSNDELHKKIVKNAQPSVSNLTHESVSLMWRHLFDTLK